MVDKDAALKHSKTLRARAVHLVDDLTRAPRDPHAKLHSRVLFLREQRLQPHFRNERLFIINAAQQRQEDELGLPLPVRPSPTVPLATHAAAASSGTGGFAGGALLSTDLLFSFICHKWTSHVDVLQAWFSPCGVVFFY